MNPSFLRGALAALILAPAVHAQWKTETYSLKGGWNAIYLHGDASHTTPAELFKNYPQVLEVWRWNPNPDQVQFSDSPSDPDASSSEWTIWNRNDPAEQQLSAMIGQSAYLVNCSGASSTTTSVPILQKPKPPAATWLISGANLLGFPAASSQPTFANYFATFQAAIASPSKIYKYIGGDLGSANPLQITPSSEKINRNSAYWFEAQVVSDFTALVEYELPGNDGIAFGRSGTLVTLGVMNRGTSAITLTFSPENSEPAPVDQTVVTGPAPLTRRLYDSATGTYSETPVSGSFTVTVPASGRLNVEFGIDRTRMNGSSNSYYASLLRVKDSANFSDVLLPVSAQVASPAGLWIGQADVSAVTSTVAGSPGTTTARSFPLRLNLHVDANGVARLLSQAYVGTLASSGNPLGICVRESSLLAEKKSEALRLVSSQMPLDRAIAGTGSFATGSSLSHTVTIPFDDPTNPFVHAYHPDHDNRDARFKPLQAGVESYNITRRLTFQFTSSPPDGSTVSGWGTTVYGGNFSETIEGLNKAPLNVAGTFVLRRISEVADINLN